MLTEQQFNAKWSEIKNGLRTLWGNLSEKEIEEVKGNIYEVTSIVERKYSESRDEIVKKIDRLLASFDNDTDKRITPDVDSYQRSPVSDRRTSFDYNTEIYGDRFEHIPNFTAAESELVDEDDGVRDPEHETFARKTYEKEKEELDDPNHHSNNSQRNPNREILDFDSDRNARH